MKADEFVPMPGTKSDDVWSYAFVLPVKELF